MPIDAKNELRSDTPRSDRQALVTHALSACWSEPLDTFITEDIPLLLTRLSRIPPVSGSKS